MTLTKKDLSQIKGVVHEEVEVAVETLTGIVNKGFNYVQKQIELIDKRLEKIEAEIRHINARLDNIEHEILRKSENILSIAMNLKPF